MKNLVETIKESLGDSINEAKKEYVITIDVKNIQPSGMHDLIKELKRIDSNYYPYDGDGADDDSVWKVVVSASDAAIKKYEKSIDGHDCSWEECTEE